MAPTLQHPTAGLATIHTLLYVWTGPEALSLHSSLPPIHTEPAQRPRLVAHQYKTSYSQFWLFQGLPCQVWSCSHVYKHAKILIFMFVSYAFSCLLCEEVNEPLCGMLIGSIPVEELSERSSTTNKFLTPSQDGGTSAVTPAVGTDTAFSALSLFFCCHAILPSHSFPVSVFTSLTPSLLGVDVSWESKDWHCQGLKLIWSELRQMWCQSFNQEGDGTTRGNLTSVIFILEWHWITHLIFTKNRIHLQHYFGERLIDWKSLTICYN